MSLLAEILAIDERDVLRAVLRELGLTRGDDGIPVTLIQPAAASTAEHAPPLTTWDGCKVEAVVGDGECIITVSDDTWTARGGITWRAVLNDPASVWTFAASVREQWDRHP